MKQAELQSRLEAQRRLTNYWFNQASEYRSEMVVYHLKWLKLCDQVRQKPLDNGPGDCVY